MRSNERSQPTNTCFLPISIKDAESDTAREHSLPREGEPLTYSCSLSSMPFETTSEVTSCSDSYTSSKVSTCDSSKTGSDIVTKPSRIVQSKWEQEALSSEDESFELKMSKSPKVKKRQVSPQQNRRETAPITKIKPSSQFPIKIYHEDLFSSSPSSNAKPVVGTVDQAKVKHRSSQNSLKTGPRSFAHVVRRNSKRLSPATTRQPLKENKTPQFRDFVEEIRRNNLVMKEEIFSSSNLRTSNVAVNVDQGDRARSSQDKVKPTRRNGFLIVRREVPHIRPLSREIDVYETGSDQEDCGDPRKPQDEALEPASTLVGEAEEPLDEGLLVSNEDWGRDGTTVHHMNRMSKFVQLPGFPEAFEQHHSYVRDLRINSGASFVSSSGIREQRTGRIPLNLAVPLQNRYPKSFKKQTVKVAPLNPNTREEGTSCTVSMKDSPTQTTRSSIEVQRSDNGSDTNQEILICNDAGQGVLLYDELLRPLTDSDGYLLKDAKGKFFVALNQYGIPVSSKRKKIFLEGNIDWETAKKSLNVVHRQTKRKITSPIGSERREATKGSQQQPSANDRSLRPDIGYQISSKVNKLSKIESRASNGSNIVASLSNSMSITELRNALLERIKTITNCKKTIEHSMLSSSRIKYLHQKTGSSGVSWVPPCYVASSNESHLHELSSDCPQYRKGIVTRSTKASSSDTSNRISSKSRALELESAEILTLRRPWGNRPDLKKHVHPISTELQSDCSSASKSWRRRFSYPLSSRDQNPTADEHPQKLKGQQSLHTRDSVIHEA